MKTVSSTLSKEKAANSQLIRRLRRLRQHPLARALAQETRLSKGHLIAPFFVREGSQDKLSSRLAAHPQRSLANLLRHLEGFAKQGGRHLILFGIPGAKDARASGAWDAQGIVQQTLRAIKKNFGPDLLAIADLCFCEYTDHGHCGILSRETGNGKRETNWHVDNDATLKLAGKTAVSLAEAGADIVAPSGMMDGQVAAIRKALDSQGFQDIPILAYAAKYASTLYGPFRELAESTPGFGDRKGYQMNPANSDEALREIRLDIEEGADWVMVKPALFYLDIIRRAKDQFHHPLAAFQVSAEAWMIEQYAQSGMAKREDVIMESHLAIRRAGAGAIISYFTEELLAIL